jgi:peptide/nickel transport system substrate-binding protein
MTVRDDVEWSDGEPLTPDDVAFTFQLLKDNPTLDIKGAWQHLESVETEGDDVVLHLKSEDAPSLAVLGQTMIVPEHIWTDVDDPGTWRNEEPVGTGPFVLGNYNDQQYSMDRNPDYWQADSVEIQHIVLPATNSQLDTVSRGYDWAYAFISDVEGTWGAANEHNSWWFPPGGVIGLMPNLDVAPFDDVNVRRGIALSLDREEIAETASEGYMEPAGQTGLVLPNQEEYLDPAIPDGGMITQDRDAALDAFAEAGYTLDGDRLVGPDGEQLEFALTTANGFADWTRAAQTVRSQLAEVGVKVTLRLPQPAGYQSAISNGDFEMAIGGMGNGDVYQAYNNLLSSEFYVPSGEPTSNNFERYRSEEADALLAEYRETVDPARQAEIVRELQAIVYEELPVIGLYYGGIWGLFSDAKFTGWPSEEDPYMIPQNYDSAPLMIFTKLKLVEGGDR